MAWVLPLLPVAAALFIVVPRRHRPPPASLAVGSLLATLGVAVWAAVAQPSATLAWSSTLELRLSVQDFGRVMAVLVPAVATPIVLYAAAGEAEGRIRLLALMVAFVGAMELLVAAADFLTLLIGWELVGALSWALIGHGWREAANPSAGTQAFVTTRLGDLGLYVAAGMTFAATGSFSFAALPEASGVELHLVAVGVLAAAASKSAQAPFSPWLFSAMAGPTSVSALLHSATMVAAGAYLVIRLAPSFGGVGWFGSAVIAVGLSTALAAGVVAALHRHPKRVLAASTSGQYGLMLVAAGAGATAAAGAHLVAHAVFKSLLFLGAGVAIRASGTEDLGRMRLGFALPAAAALSAVGALALAAVPPLGAAWSKEHIVAAIADASPWLAAAVLTVGFLSALYAARYQLLAYGPRGGSPGSRPGHRPRRLELAAMATLAAASVLLGLLWVPGAGEVVEAATAGDLRRGTLLDLMLSLAVVAAALGAAWGLGRWDRLATLGVPVSVRMPASDWLGLPTAARVLVADPALHLSRELASFDDRVIDAGVRITARIASLLSGLLAGRGEVSLDGAVRAVAGAVMRGAAGSRFADDRVIDRAVEDVAGGVGVSGRASRRLQTGLSHHYYVIVAVGLVAAVVVLAAMAGR